jgi:hypothetical protein
VRKWDPHALVAVILAFGVTGTLVLLIAVEFIPHHGHVSDAEAAALSTALGAAIGAIATYLGIEHQNGKRRSPIRCPYCGEPLDEESTEERDAIRAERQHGDPRGHRRRRQGPPDAGEGSGSSPGAEDQR